MRVGQSCVTNLNPHPHPHPRPHPHPHPGEAAIIARAAKYLARRVCLPRGVVSPQTAAAMRCVLLGLANEAEAYAWTSSGGLL